jgi:hypothetical protein
VGENVLFPNDNNEILFRVPLTIVNSFFNTMAQEAQAAATHRKTKVVILSRWSSKVVNRII